MINQFTYTIFAPDNQDRLFVEKLKYAWRRFTESGLTNGNLIPCVGSYFGETELSFLCRSDDYERHLKKHAEGQESILRISQCNKAYAYLEYLDDGALDYIGCMKAVSKSEAADHHSWTKRLDTGTYWVAVKSNPETLLHL